eukprot:1157543-Pelagomonas_calceolata.AAC.13
MAIAIGIRQSHFAAFCVDHFTLIRKFASMLQVESMQQQRGQTILQVSASAFLGALWLNRFENILMSEAPCLAAKPVSFCVLFLK